MRLLYIIPFIIGTTTIASESNEVMKACIKNTKDIVEASACHAEYRKTIRDIKTAELRQFLKDNPRYRFPGQSWNKCFGKPKELGVSKVETTLFTTTVYYKEYIKTCIDVEN